MRILFATLVLLSHAPELMDGNRTREVFSRITASQMSFGEFAVDGFFLLSGYLIVKSWQGDPELVNFLEKRLLRIVPGYLIAALVSTLAVGLLAPGVEHFFHHLRTNFVISLVSLGPPDTPRVFPGTSLDHVNSALWTIPYELRCYFAVALFGVTGLLRRWLPWVLTTLVLLAGMLMPAVAASVHWTSFVNIFGIPQLDFRLFAVYFVGGSFFLLRKMIPYSRLGAALALLLILAVRTWEPAHLEPAIVVFGGYLMFYFTAAQGRSSRRLPRFPDVSYGMYLYGWPVESLLIWYLPHRSPAVIFLAATVLCAGLGYVSWHFVERPSLQLRRRATAPLPPAK